MPAAEALATLIQERLSDRVKRAIVVRGEVTIEIAAQELPGVARVLRDDPRLSFRQLVDLCGVDYLGYGDAEWETSDLATASGFSRGVDREEPRAAPITEGRFRVIYHLLSHQHNRRLRIRLDAPGDPPRVDSVTEIWPAANWFEREAFDLYGILFPGHPDLRRILTDYGFIGHPFRKDFPLIGEVEMRYDPDRQRVIYEPVSITPRTLVPRVIRRDHTPRRKADPDHA